jgi:hypothetical protein
MHQKPRHRILVVAIFSLGAIQACDQSPWNGRHLPDTISYTFHIRPILSDKCFACHGPDANKRQAGLRLDVAENAYKPLDENPEARALVPGETGLSEVFLRICSQDSSRRMPPVESNLALTQREISLIGKWIKQGAKYESHWAFTPPEKPDLPVVKDPDWPLNEIDYFILKKQEENGLTPNKEAGKERLLKRVCFDITGLPPSLQMMDDFLSDHSDDAYEKMVDQLLEDPAYGERMAVHWMDVARYADSHGYQDDGYRSQWPWRDWVIHAFNRNMPYDQFITWQLAGDLMPHATKEQLLATAFNRNHKITEEGGVIAEEYRVAYVVDRTNTLGKGILGITLECANCHDHKYDPLTQKEYFQLYAFFNNVSEKGVESAGARDELDTRHYAKQPMMEISNTDVEEMLTFINKPDTNRLVVSVMGDLDTLRGTFVLERGAYDAPGEAVQAATPESILPFDRDYPKNRLGLAQWLFDRRNPLTSRVFVNRIWQEFFGKGIVATPGDFGMQSELPSHPELLDWLAADFSSHGWDIKRLVKQIVTSSTYRQSAAVTRKIQQADPDNVLLARAPRYRMKVEFIRDMILSSSGLLVDIKGGPSVKPYQPEGLWEAATSGRGDLTHYRQDSGKDLYRRGLYTFIKRTVPPPSMLIFDASNRDQCEVKRLNTNTPLQALVMMNDPTVLEASRVLAARLLMEDSDMKAKIIKAFRLIVCRTPVEEETRILEDYYKEELKSVTAEIAANLLDVGEYPLAENIDHVSLASLMLVLRTLYNLDEVITKS